MQPTDGAAINLAPSRASAPQSVITGPESQWGPIFGTRRTPLGPSASVAGEGRRRHAPLIVGENQAFNPNVPANQIESATKAYPFIPLSQQTYWLGSTAGDTSSPIVKAYQQTGQFLVKQGRLTSAPSAAQIATHIDPTFVKKALSGGC